MTKRGDAKGDRTEAREEEQEEEGGAHVRCGVFVFAKQKQRQRREQAGNEDLKNNEVKGGGFLWDEQEKGKQEKKA